MTEEMKCANEIAQWLAECDLIIDTFIYVDNKRYIINSSGELLYDMDADPHDYFDFVGDFLSMSFEGPLYDVLNGTSPIYKKRQKELAAILKRYNKYYNLGNSWNLGVYSLSNN